MPSVRDGSSAAICRGTAVGSVGRVVVLVSGSGTNLQALLDAGSPDWKVVGVVSDRPGVGALERAAAHGVSTSVVDWSAFADRTDFTTAISEAVAGFAPDLVVLAGFMRILGAEAVERFSGRIINIHPSLLPAFPGAHAVRDALDAGAGVTGCTVHIVDELVDHGPVLRQTPVPILAADDEATLHARIQQAEHVLLPEVVQDMMTGRLDVVDGEAIGAVES